VTMETGIWRAAATLLLWSLITVTGAAAYYTDMVTAVAGEPTVLPCGGGPANLELLPTTATWHRRPTGGSAVPATDARYQLREDNSLVLEHVRPEDEGRFTCTDTTTEQLIAVYDLKVRKPSVVRVESNGADQPLSEGDTFWLTCRVLTDSAAHAAQLLVWRGDALLRPDDPRASLTAQRSKNVWRLSVANVTRDDTARYSCRAKTYFDRAEAAVQLTVAPRVTADCTGGSAELGWSAAAGAPAAGFLVRMTVDGEVVDEALVPGNMTSVEVKDLAAGSQVQFQVEAVESGAVPGEATCLIPV